MYKTRNCLTPNATQFIFADLEKVDDNVLDEVEVLELGPEHDEVEGGDGVDVPRVRVDGVQVPAGGQCTE